MKEVRERPRGKWRWPRGQISGHVDEIMRRKARKRKWENEAQEGTAATKQGESARKSRKRRRQTGHWNRTTRSSNWDTSRRRLVYRCGIWVSSQVCDPRPKKKSENKKLEYWDSSDGGEGTQPEVLRTGTAQDKKDSSGMANSNRDLRTLLTVLL